ncbi:MULTISPECIES: NAD-dependent epimerase/dehydratase family protein [unclassified Devosia]|uniref:NAD-dependent epimerase/dehydratase family protein n=1 Tax=unclassified Devosia TaxID=196773 RepID=UPI00086AA516|nr:MULTISPECIES: NAD-dependent epimerase/dehydratase family protein [unclassified Devosia]MBN9362583.1 NAD-dependent epimerase/dehydratase family protein [Devosia sp.]ODS83271.1 MAG: NAD-dependent epimerase [Devosia sp. SCN 66-27]OJX23770.1 MAG: NAD-dependent epimerase [Devosia sp. 66-14]
MQTILGASGQIGQELARALKRDFANDIRLVSRNPRKVNDTDHLQQANLLDPAQTMSAVEGSDIVYLTAGLPMDTKLWVEQWPVMMRNVIDACAAHGAKLVFFDNTYMYPQTAEPQTESMRFEPNGEKGRVRAAIANDLLGAMAQGRVTAMISRAPEFYGPGKTQSITNSAILEPLRDGKAARVFLRDDTLRSLIFTPDASRAMALLGNTQDAYGQTWHLPCDDNRLTYRGFITLAARTFGTKPRYTVLKRWQLRLAGLFSAAARDAAELLPRYAQDNIFVSDKFKMRFPDFRVTSFDEGLAQLKNA